MCHFVAHSQAPYTTPADSDPQTGGPGVSPPGILVLEPRQPRRSEGIWGFWGQRLGFRTAIEAQWTIFPAYTDQYNLKFKYINNYNIIQYCNYSRLTL